MPFSWCHWRIYGGTEYELLELKEETEDWKKTEKIVFTWILGRKTSFLPQVHGLANKSILNKNNNNSSKVSASFLCVYMVILKSLQGSAT